MFKLDDATKVLRAFADDLGGMTVEEIQRDPVNCHVVVQQVSFFLSGMAEVMEKASEAQNAEPTT